MTRFGLGYRPDPEHLRARHRLLSARPLSQLLGVSSTPPSVDLRPLLPPVFDQGQTGACTGHALAAGVYAACTTAGKSLAFVPSPADLYRLERCLERAAAGDLSAPLTDGGAMPSDGLLALARFGVRPMGGPTSDGRFSDADLATINAEPELEGIEAETFAGLVVGLAIASVGDQLLADVQAALASNLPITLSVPGGSPAFQNYTGAGVIGAINAELDHYVTLAGYERAPDGAVKFRLRNSWGEGWGDGGYAWIDPGFLAICGDLYAIKVG